MEATVTRAHKDAAILKLLGYDTRTHGIEPFIGPTWRGLRVLDAKGRPVRFVKEGELAEFVPSWRRESARIARLSAAYNAKAKRRARIKRLAVRAALTVAALGLVALWIAALVVTP